MLYIWLTKGFVCSDRGIAPDQGYTPGRKEAKMPTPDWIGIISLFGITVTIDWWVVKSYVLQIDRRFEQLEALMIGLVGDVGLLKGAMGVYPSAKERVGSGE